jgi:hypothetical protein
LPLAAPLAVGRAARAAATAPATPGVGDGFRQVSAAGAAREGAAPSWEQRVL